ncbi:putative survival protein SurE [Helianthus annuus]|nr:putative survival protein SurE [Helianthus annuus]
MASYTFIICDVSCLQGFKLTKQSSCRSKPIWQAIAANRNPSAARYGNQPGMGLQFAQLGRDASAAFQDSNQEDTDENLDFRALENGFVSILNSYLKS